MTHAAREACGEIGVRPSGTVLPILPTGSLVENGTLGEGLQTLAAAYCQYYIRPANEMHLAALYVYLGNISWIRCCMHEAW